MTLRALWPVVNQFQNKNGSILTSGRVYVYYKNRTALAEIFSDEEGTVVRPNPVLLDNNGRATVFADTAYSYTIVVCDYYGKELFSQDITIHYDSSAAKDVKVTGTDSTVKVDTTTLPNGVQYDLSVNTEKIATKESVEHIKSSLIDKQDKLTPGSNIAITNNVISATGIPTKTSELTNDSGFITSAAGTWVNVPLTQLMQSYFYTDYKYMHLRKNDTLRLGELYFAVQITDTNFGSGWVDIFSFEPFGTPRQEGEVLQFRLFQQQPGASSSQTYDYYTWIFASIVPHEGKIRLNFAAGKRELQWIQPTSSFFFTY